MTTLFDATRPRKTRKTFGRGILPYSPRVRAPFPTFEDQAWWAQASQSAAELEWEASLAAAADRAESGWVS